MDSETHAETAVTRLWHSAAQLLMWIGGSAGTITLVLSACGYLVEHAYLDSLGVPRTFFEATPAEYVTAGGKFLIGIVPLAAAGAAQFLVRLWWLALVMVAAGVSAWWWHWRTEWRWLAAAGFLALWQLLVLPQFDRSLPRQDANALVAMLTTVVVAGIVYAYAELTLGETPASVRSSLLIRSYAVRLPFFALLISAAVALPYLRGAYALTRIHPDIEFLGKDREYFCELAGEGKENGCGHDGWQLIEVGTARAIVRRVADGKIYVVPADALKTFRIVLKETP